MNLITKRAVLEAKRFITAAESIPHDACFYSCMERASAKRASMDLTRVLAEFRLTQANDWERK